MHRYDIRAELQKKGLTLTQVSLSAGLSARACSYALLFPAARAEAAIAKALGRKPETLWPSRYSADGGRIRQPRRRPADKQISARQNLGGQS